MRRTTRLLIALTLGWTTASSQAAMAQPSGDLPALVRAAANTCTTFSAQDLADVQDTLAASVTRLDEYLTPGGENGQAWKNYLKWNDLAEQLGGDVEFDAAKLAAVYRRYRANHVGLELPVFSNVADALRRYIDVSKIARLEDVKERYAQQLERLATDLDKYEAEQDEETAGNIGRRLGFIAGVGKSPHIVSAIRNRYAQPNLYASAATSLLNAKAMQPVQQSQHVSDCILGTSISGTATTNGILRVATVPCYDRAHLQLVLEGSIYSSTVGENGPVCIYSTGNTSFCAIKDLFVSANLNVTVTRAAASATTSTNIYSIQTKRQGIGSRMIQKIAWRKAGKQKGQAEAIASRHARQRIAARFDQDASAKINEAVAKARTNYDQKFRLPLTRRGEMPERLDVSTTSHGIEITALQANRSQLGAPTLPPTIDGGHDLAVRVHESLPNNVAGALIAGYTLTDEWLKKKVLELKGELPPELQDEDQDPWSITFARVRPVSTSFKNGGFTITIRGSRFKSGDRKTGALNITAAYKIETRPKGIVLVRQGNVEVLPPGFDPEKDSLSAEQSALREILIKRLDPLFKAEIPAEGIELPGQLKSLGRLRAGEVASNNGWLTIGWNRLQ